MSDVRYTLRTVGALSLSGPAGPIRPSDPLALPLLCRVVLAGPAGVVDADLQLVLTPDLTAAKGAERLARARNALERAAGTDLVRRTTDRWVADPVMIDVDVTLDPDGTPLDEPARASFLAGVAIDGAPEFVEWVESVRPRLGRRAAPEPPAPHLAKRSVRRGTSAVIMAGGLGLLLAVYFTRAKPPAGFVAGDPVVLADLDNQTGDTLFDRSLIAAAAIGIQQSPQLRIASRERIVATLKRMQVPGADTVQLDPELAREVAIRGNIRYYVALKLERAGDAYQLTGTVNDATTGTVTTVAKANAETRAGTIAALDRIVQELRAGFGERRSERAARSVPLPEATTRSLEALQSYATGTRAWSRGDFQLARELWERSLDLDTGFTLAMASLGSFHYYHHTRDRGEQYYREALKRIGRVTEWEQLRILNNYAGYRGDTDSANVIGKVMAERFPNAANWYNYGTGLMQSDRPAEAIVALQRALSFDTGYVNAYLNLATSSSLLGRIPDAIRYYEQAARLDTTALLRPPISTEYGEKLILAGRLDDAERHFQSVLSRPALFDRTLAHRGLGSLALWQGKVDEALRHFRDASEAGRQDGTPLTIARNRLLEALTLLIAGDTAVARQTLARAGPIVDSMHLEPEFIALFGNGYLRVGEVDHADLMLTKIIARGDTLSMRDRAAWHFLAGSVATAQGDPAAGLIRLDSAARFRMPAARLTWRAEALRARGDLRGAMVALDSILDHPVATSEDAFDWYGAFLTKGKLAEAAGDKRLAATTYRRLLDQWQHGDSAAGLARVIRGRLAALDPR